MKSIWILLLAFLAPTLFAQQPSQEALETLRFVRMAETKKNLGFLDDATLLKLNEILDDYEKKRFELRRKEARLKIQAAAAEEELDDATAAQLLERWHEVRASTYQNDTQMHQQVRELLDNKSAVRFYVFYEKFQRDVRRRINKLRGENNQRPNRFRRNNRNFDN